MISSSGSSLASTASRHKKISILLISIAAPGIRARLTSATKSCAVATPAPSYAEQSAKRMDELKAAMEKEEKKKKEDGPERTLAPN